MIKFNDIIISENFLQHPPSDKKYEMHLKFLEKHGYFKKSIIVDENGVLIDGYCTYLLGLQFPERLNEIYILSKNQANFCTYIYGIHKKPVQNAQKPKEYVWKIVQNNKKMSDYCDKHILPGDLAVVDTKFGEKVVIVTKIVKSQTKPIKKPIKKVIDLITKDSINTDSLTIVNGTE